MYFKSTHLETSNAMQAAPPYNFLLGHMLQAKNAFETLPPMAHSSYTLAKVGEKFTNGAYYFDTWPLFTPILIITNPRMANELVNHPIAGYRKPDSLRVWMEVITGGPSFFDTNGQAWRHPHSVASPAFSAANINAAVPIMLDRVQVFKSILLEKAQAGEQFPVEPMTLRLVSDTIGEFLLNIKMNTQRRGHPLAEAMLHQLKLKFLDYKPEYIFAGLNPFTRYKTWKNSRTLDNHIADQLNHRFKVLKQAKASGLGDPTEFKAILDLKVEDYLSDPKNMARDKPDGAFVTQTARDMRMLFFNGYDSTASTMACCLYMIYRHPTVLAQLRAEHDEVLGANPAAAVQTILHNPSILNSLPYTLATIKETLRIFPPANGLREGCPDLVLRDDNGVEYPTEGLSIEVLHWTMHHDERWWPRPDEFLPERFMVEPDHELYPAKGAWRPFEAGPRACLGQQMVLTEIKTMLACVVREFEFYDFYEDGKGDAGAVDLDLTGVRGQRAYLVEAGAAHPNEGIPCRVKHL